MTTRKQAMQWFNGLSSLRKTQLCDTNTDIVGSVRRWETLTGRGIEEIWLNEQCLKAYGTALKDTKQEDINFISKVENNSVKKVESIENIYLNRLKEQYKRYKDFDKKDYTHITKKHHNDYKAMRIFCLDTQLVSFNDIEVMEYEVNQSF